MSPIKNFADEISVARFCFFYMPQSGKFMKLQKYILSCLLTVFSSCAFAEDFWWEAQTEIKLYEADDDGAKVVDTLPKGTVLHASYEAAKKGWFGVYETAADAKAAAAGEQLYIHLLYKLPEGKAYVKNENLRPTLKAVPGRSE